MTGDDAPEALLTAARTIVANPAALPGTAWARGAALLTRQALEASLDRYWAARAAGMEDCNETTKLLCLPAYLGDPAVARRARQVWSSLSRACHHHPYELAPTTGELHGWMDEVGDVVACLARAARPQ